MSENLQNVPVAVSAFTGADLQRQNAVKITDIGRLTPGISFRQSSTNPSGLLVSMRGEFQRDTIASVDPSVGTYVDGVYWARSYGLNADLVDLQNVQILKGPQSTLFGRNTTGGAVVVQTNDPQYDKVSGMASVLYGRFNERTGTAMVNLPIVQDRVALRGAIQISKRDGYTTDFLSGKKYDDRDNITGRLKLGIKVTDKLNFVFSAERFRFNQAGQSRAMDFLLPGSFADIYINDVGPIGGMTGQQFVAYAQAHPSLTAQNNSPGHVPPSPENDLPHAHYVAETYTGTGTLDTGIGTFKLITAYRGTSGHSSLDLEGSPWAVYQTYGFQNLIQYSSELQLTGKAFDNKLSYVGGLYWFHEFGHDDSNAYALVGDLTSASAAVRATSNAGKESDAHIDNTSKAAYGQVTWHVTDRLNVTGGLRYSVDNKGIALGSYTVNGVGAFLACGLPTLGQVRAGNICTSVRRSDRFPSWSYLASADYRITDEVMVYVRADKGFRSGGENARAVSTFDFVPFKPEIVHDIEIGVKSELLDRRLRLNVAAYHSIDDGKQLSEQILPAGSAVSLSVFGNAAKARIDGLEAEATAILGGGFRASGSVALTRPKYLEFADLTGDRRAERFNGVPRTQFSLMGGYDHDLGFANLNLQADYSWASATPLDEYNKPGTAFNDQIVAATTRPAGGTLNARGSLSFEDGRYEVAVFGRNILNNRSLSAALQIIAFGFIGGQYQEPATYGVQATYHFGQ